ncbi:MAG: hypothetical protein ABL879_07550 [Devosia sp.]
MTRNQLYVLVGILVLIVAALGGYLLYQQANQPSLEIRADGGGIKVSGNG